jgi:hypothetical protein
MTGTINASRSILWVILLVKLTAMDLHHRGRTGFSKAQTATVVGIEGIDQLPFRAGELQEFPQVNPPVQAVSLHVKEIGAIEKQGDAHTPPVM